MEHMQENNNTMQKIKNSLKNPVYIWAGAGLVVIIALILIFVPHKKAVVLEEGCSPGFTYNTITGKLCPIESASMYPEGCKPEYKFSELTGAPCPQEGNKKDALDTSSSESSSTSVPASSSSSTSLSLADALVQYNGKTLEIGKACVITPATQSQNTGTRILVHNESTVAHTISIGSESFSLKPYRYRTVVLDTAGEVTVKCDSKEASTITVH
jgi:hypothetical protein